MPLETLLVALCLGAAFGAVPIAVLLHAHAATSPAVRHPAVRHVETVKAIAGTRLGEATAWFAARHSPTARGAAPLTPV